MDQAAPARTFQRVYLQPPAPEPAAVPVPAVPPPTPPRYQLSPLSAATREEVAERRGMSPDQPHAARTLPEHDRLMARRADLRQDLQAARSAGQGRKVRRIEAQLHHLKP